MKIDFFFNELMAFP